MKLRYYVGIWLLLAGGGFPKAALGQTEYFALFMEGRKVGHAIRSRVVTGGKVTSAEGVSIQLSRAGVAVSISTTETCIETTDGEPLGFEAAQDLGIATMKVVGIVNERGMVNVTTTTMGAEHKGEFAWPSGAVMAEGLRLLELKQGLREGASYTAKVFSPAILQTLETEIRIGPKQNIDLLGRVVALTEVTTTYGMPGAGVIVSTSYVDEELRVQKDILPIAGMQMEIIACAKEFALGENDVFEFIDKMILPSPTPLGDVRSVKSVSYHLSLLSKGSSFTIPSGDNQSVRRLRDGGAIVTVKPVAAPRGVRFPYRGRDREILEALEPTRYLQSDSREIKGLALHAVGRASDAGEAVKRIESFVGDYITEKNFSVGYASAAEVAASRVGDCSEHAVLVAAMCRAVGIPAKVVSGLVYTDEFGGRENVFGGHAWVEAYVGGSWIGLDASGVADGYGAGHIALAVGNGNPEDFLGLLSSLGRFKIDRAVVNKGR
jgi:hypothetical protein